MSNERNEKPIMCARAKVSQYFSGLSPKTLANWSCEKRGPQFFKVGRKVFYKLSDLEEFMTQNPIQTTGEIQ